VYEYSSIFFFQGLAEGPLAAFFAVPLLGRKKDGRRENYGGWEFPIYRLPI